MARSRRSSAEKEAKIFECACNWVCAVPYFCLLVLIGFCIPVHRPKFYFEEFYVPALHTSPDNPNSNITRTSHTIFFDLKLHNSMDGRGVRYYPLNLTFHYVPNATFSSNSSILVANYTVPGFYQGYGKSAMRRDVVVASGVPWSETIRAVSGGSTALFKVRLQARMKFKFMASYAWRKGVDVWANVEVDSSGRKAQKDGVRFFSISAA